MGSQGLRSLGTHTAINRMGWKIRSDHLFQLKPRKTKIMLGWAITFFILALVAGILGFGGIAGASAGIAKILFFVFLVLLIISAISRAVRGRTP